MGQYKIMKYSFIKSMAQATQWIVIIIVLLGPEHDRATYKLGIYKHYKYGHHRMKKMQIYTVHRV